MNAKKIILTVVSISGFLMSVAALTLSIVSLVKVTRIHR